MLLYSCTLLPLYGEIKIFIIDLPQLLATISFNPLNADAADVVMMSTVQLVVNVVDTNDNVPMFPLSQYIVQGIAETVAVGTDIIQGYYSRSIAMATLVRFSVN